MKFLPFFLLIFLVFCGGLFAQNVSLDQAIKSSVQEIESRLPQRGITAIMVFTSPSQALSDYIISELATSITNSNRIQLVERQYRDAIRKERIYQMSGAVSDDEVRRAGKELGAQYVVTGSLEYLTDFYHFTLATIDIGVEGGLRMAASSINIKKNDRRIKHYLGRAGSTSETVFDWERLMFDSGYKLTSLGINAGSSSGTPLLVVNANFTIPVSRFTFFEGGVDFGTLPYISSNEKAGDINYHSWYYYGRYNFFLPITDWLGWYIGAGGGLMDAYYQFPQADVSMRIPALDAATGLIFGLGRHNLLRFNYALRTNFSGINHRVTAGYAFRF